MSTIYIGERQSGKTTMLIEMSEKTGATIVVCENVNSKCEKNIKKYNQASRANSSRHSANTISAVFQPNISRG